MLHRATAMGAALLFLIVGTGTVTGSPPADESCIKTADNKIVCGREKQACVTTPDGVLICGAEVSVFPLIPGCLLSTIEMT